MSEIDEKLAALFAEDLPPARDASFRIAVLAGIERRRVAVQLALLTAVCALMSLVLWSFAPMIAPWLIGQGEVIAALCTAAVLVWACVVAVRQGVRA